MSLLLKGDMVLIADLDWRGRAVRQFQRDRAGESPSIVNHARVVVEDMVGESCMEVESLPQGTVLNEMFSTYGKVKNQMTAIFRNRKWTLVQRDYVAMRARSFIGKPYGYPAIVGCALSWIFGRVGFRKIFSNNKSPTCSQVAAYAAYAAKTKFVGLDPDMVEPDDMWDEFVRNEDWLCVHPFDKLSIKNIIDVEV